MINAKNLLFTLIISGMIVPVSVKADNRDDAFRVLATAGIVAAAGYGIYKVYERDSFNSAQKNVDAFEDTLQTLYPKYQYSLNHQQVVSAYKNNLHAFGALKNDASHDEQRLHAMKESLQSIQYSWATTSYAARLVNTAQELYAQNKTLSAAVHAHQATLEQLTPVINIENMLSQENQTGFSDIVNARNKQAIDFEATLTTAYAQSQWPFLQAHKDINNRKQEYQYNINSFGTNAQEFASTLSKATQMVAAYHQTQSRIVTHPRYTDDQRYKQQHDNAQEALRIERQKLEAARREAHAAEVQAQAEKEKAYAARRQARATEAQAEAAQVSAYAAQRQARAAEMQARAAQPSVIVVNI